MSRDEPREVIHRQAGTFGSAVGGGAGCVVGIAVGVGLLMLGSCLAVMLLFGGCTAIVGESAARRAEHEAAEARSRATATTAKSTPAQDEPARPTSPPTRTVASPKEPERPPEVVVTMKPRKGTHPALAADVATWREYDDALLNDKAAVVRLTGAGKIILVLPAGVRVVKLNAVQEFTYVRLADGDHKGSVYVVPTREVEFSSE